ncbi:MAG: ABC transporter substrate-binding protein [Burkholderiales bacterium]
MTARRTVLRALALAALTRPLGALAQRAPKLRRIGVLAVGVSTGEQQQWAQMHFVALLRRAGFEEGRDVALEWRYAEGDAARLPALADELVRLNVDLIVASFNQSIAAAKRATRSIPIVMLNAIAPVEQGYVESLARPGGNVTGTAWSAPETMGKILEMLKEGAPQATRVAFLGNPGFPGDGSYKSAVQEAKSKLGMTIQFFDAARPEDIGPALQRIAAAKPHALYAALDTALLSGAREIAEFALKRRLVSMSTAPQFVDAGGLLYYGPDINELAERTVSYVVRILNGAKPTDLPVELPTRYKLIINKKTANAIGHKIPAALLLRADRVIE